VKGYAHLAGFLMLYTKLALSFEQQVFLLQHRGLEVGHPAEAAATLSRISYYRLSAYFKPFKLNASDNFTPGTTFQEILDLYQFDKDLRFLLSDPLEAIEVYFRTRITYELAIRGDAFAHCNATLFLNQFDHPNFLDKQDKLEGKATVQFVKHFRNKYKSEKRLPVWMATELMSFGTLSWLFPNLALDIQKAISDDLNIDRSVLKSWLLSLSYVRNICAHHARLWNRELAIRPMIPKNPRRWSYPALDNKRCYAIFILLHDIMSRIHPNHPWSQDLVTYLSRCNDLQLAGMQVPKAWRLLPPWSRLA
jgi:abortive infection bacteriophage resistance protein